VLRSSARALRKSPGFALTAISTLALAIAANAIVFSVLNALILRPLDVPRFTRTGTRVFTTIPAWSVAS